MKHLKKLLEQRIGKADIKKAVPAIVAISVIILIVVLIFGGGGSFLAIFLGIIILIIIGVGTFYLLKQTNQLPTNYPRKKRVTVEEISKELNEQETITEVEILNEDDH